MFVIIGKYSNTHRNTIYTVVAHNALYMYHNTQPLMLVIPCTTLCIITSPHIHSHHTSALSSFPSHAVISPHTYTHTLYTPSHIHPHTLYSPPRVFNALNESTQEFNISLSIAGDVPNECSQAEFHAPFLFPMEISNRSNVEVGRLMSFLFMLSRGG